MLAGPGTALTVEAIAKKAGLGAGTVVRAFGGKDALVDAAVSGLLEPVVQRGRELLEQTRLNPALRTFLAELIAFQSAHHAVDDQSAGSTCRLRRPCEQLVKVARRCSSGHAPTARSAPTSTPGGHHGDRRDGVRGRTDRVGGRCRRVHRRPVRQSPPAARLPTARLILSALDEFAERLSPGPDVVARTTSTPCRPAVPNVGVTR